MLGLVIKPCLGYQALSWLSSLVNEEVANACLEGFGTLTGGETKPRTAVILTRLHLA